MANGSTVLAKMLIEDLESDFLKRFQSRILPVWNEAKSRSIDDENIDNDLQRYAFGQTR